MAKTTSGPAATQDTSAPEPVAPAAVEPAAVEVAAAPRCWRYVGGVERILGDLSLHVVDGDVLEAVEPPGHPDWWVEADGPATVTPGQPSGFRVWTPDELQRGALAEDPPTTPGWTDPDTTDDQATEVDQ